MLKQNLINKQIDAGQYNNGYQKYKIIQKKTKINKLIIKQNQFKNKLIINILKLKELNYKKLVSNNYKFENQPTISINLKD